MQQSSSSGFQNFLIIDFYAVVSTIRDSFWRIGMRSLDWWFGYPHSSAIAQITLSSITLCLPIGGVEYFRASCDGSLSSSWWILCFQKVFVFIKIHLEVFCDFWIILCICYWHYTSSWNRSSVLYWMCVLMFVTVLAVVIYHEQSRLHYTYERTLVTFQTNLKMRLIKPERKQARSQVVSAVPDAVFMSQWKSHRNLRIKLRPYIRRLTFRHRASSI